MIYDAEPIMGYSSLLYSHVLLENSHLAILETLLVIGDS